MQLCCIKTLRLIGLPIDLFEGLALHLQFHLRVFLEDLGVALAERLGDGITAVEGNGPLQGSPRDLGKIALADDPVAADATCARLMRFEATRVKYIRMAGEFLGNADERAIEMVGERISGQSNPFAVLPAFSYLLRRSVQQPS